MISYDLAGRTALVTGGASGIGFATARMLAKFGATVAVNILADDPRGPGGGREAERRRGKAIVAPGSVGEKGSAERDGAEGDQRSRAARSAGEQCRHAGHAQTHPAAGTGSDHRRSVVATAGNQSARRVPLRQGRRAGAEGDTGRDRQHRLDCRSGTGGKQPRLQCNQGRCGQPDAEPRPRAGAGGAGECDRAGCGGQLLDGGMDQRGARSSRSNGRC